MPLSGRHGGPGTPSTMIDFFSPGRRARLPVRQRGQALIFGILLVLGAAVATFFMFNTGQMTAEKTKLVNAADAVAYSAGVMHARALNFDAYTNRALIANEASIAQMVSISSWLQYAQGHIKGVPRLSCYSQYSIPVALATVEYVPLCYALSYPPLYTPVVYANNAFNTANIGNAIIMRAEIAKTELKLMQLTMFASFSFERTALMRDVADANYRDDGSVSIDAVPLDDDWNFFEGSAPFIAERKNNARTRMKETIVASAHKDKFVHERAWSSKSPWPCSVPIGEAKRTGKTVLKGFTSWEATDSANFRVRSWRGIIPSCKNDKTYGLGSGSRQASTSAAWRYSGVPDFYELSDAALAYSPNSKNPAKRGDPRVQFAIRLTRDKGQTRTSAGTAPERIKPGGRLAVFDGAPAAGVLAAVATSEVFFDHQQSNGATELGSLFNPYWQVHLVGNSAASVAAARVKQGATP